MDSAPATPRVNSQLLSKYRGKTVRLVGKVLQSMGGKASMQLSDKGEVVVRLVSTPELPVEEYFEILGRVEDDFSVLESNFTHFGSSMDLDSYNRLVVISQSFPDMFGL